MYSLSLSLINHNCLIILYIIIQLMETWQNSTGSLIPFISKSIPTSKHGKQIHINVLERHVVYTCLEVGHVLIIHIPWNTINKACSATQTSSQTKSACYNPKQKFPIIVSEPTTTPFCRSKMASRDQSFGAGETKGRAEVTNVIQLTSYNSLIFFFSCNIWTFIRVCCSHFSITMKY